MSENSDNKMVANNVFLRILPMILFHIFIMPTNNVINARIRWLGNTQFFIYYDVIELLSGNTACSDQLFARLCRNVCE